MVEISVKVNLENQISETSGPMVVLGLQVVATLIAIVYVVYETAYPYLAARRATEQRKKLFET